MTPSDPTYVHITPDGVTPHISVGSPFRCVVILDTELDDTQRLRISNWLLDADCLYLMAWGVECERFHDQFDLANIERHPDDIPDNKFVMTTWHTNDTLLEAFWFCQFCAIHSYDDRELSETVIVEIGEQPRRDERLAQFVNAGELDETDDV